VPNLERPRVEYLTPEDLVRDVIRGFVRIPRFQRGFKWEAGDVVKLFDSLLRGYPIGNLVLWNRPAPAQRLHVGPLVVDAAETDSARWVVDGQQRIVSLVGALTSAHEAADHRFRVHLDLDDGEFHTVGPRQQPPASWVPVSILLDTATLRRWMRDNAEWLADDQLALVDQAAEAIREFQIPAYVVTSDNEATLLEIFTRMNMTGKRLTRSEVFQALRSGTSGDEPADLHDVGRVPAELGFGSLDGGLTLRCVLAFRGGDAFSWDLHGGVVPGVYMPETFRGVADALREAVGFLRDTAGIPHVRLLPYSYVLPVLVRFVRLHGRPDGRAATLLRRWVWRGAVANTRARGIGDTDFHDQVSAQVSAVGAADPLTAAVRLLARVQTSSDFDPDLEKIRFDHPITKINVLGLLSVGPRDPASGEIVDAARLLEHERSPLQPILPDESHTRARSIANRVVMESGPSFSFPFRALVSATPEVAASHLVDAQAQRALAEKRFDDFLERRAEAAAKAIRTHVDNMAEWGARDGRAVSDILRTVA
jgi:hypothetical protein